MTATHLMIPDSQFTSTFLNLNHLAEACPSWLFLPGMLFKETQAWWKPAPRQTPHEGIDLLFLSDRDGQRRDIPPEAMIPPLWDGEVIAVFEDFLGSTVAVDEWGRKRVRLDILTSKTQISKCQA